MTYINVMLFFLSLDVKMSATLRVILGIDDTSKFTVPSGIPGKVEQLKGEIQFTYQEHLGCNTETLSLTISLCT